MRVNTANLGRFRRDGPADAAPLSSQVAFGRMWTRLRRTGGECRQHSASSHRNEGYREGWSSELDRATVRERPLEQPLSDARRRRGEPARRNRHVLRRGNRRAWPLQRQEPRALRSRAPRDARENRREHPRSSSTASSSRWGSTSSSSVTSSATSRLAKSAIWPSDSS